MKVGLFIGRFQPFHLGHLSVIEAAQKEVDFLVIGIGSAQYSNSPENPFSFEEREGMIQAVVSGNYKIIPLEDNESNSVWLDNLEKKIGKFDCVYTGNALVKELLESRGYEIKPVVEKFRIRGHDLRRMMAFGDGGWKKMTHPKVVEIIKKIGGQERVKKIVILW